MTIENTVVVLVVLAHGIRCMTMKSILNSKLMVTPTVISDSKFCWSASLDTGTNLNTLKQPLHQLTTLGQPLDQLRPGSHDSDY